MLNTEKENSSKQKLKYTEHGKKHVYHMQIISLHSSTFKCQFLAYRGPCACLLLCNNFNSLLI